MSQLLNSIHPRSAAKAGAKFLHWKQSLLVVVLLASLSGFSQNERQTTYLSITGGGLNIAEFDRRPYFGLELDVHVTERLSLQYRLLFGDGYFHMPLAPIGGAYGGLLIIGIGLETLEISTLEIGVLLGVLTALLPEGISYSFPVNEQWALAPYVHPLQFEVIASEGRDSFAGGSIGTRVHSYFFGGKMRLSPYVEYKMHYHNPIHNGVSVGVNLGIGIGDLADQLMR